MIRIGLQVTTRVHQRHITTVQQVHPLPRKRNRPVSSPDFASAHTKRAHMDNSTEENKNNSGTSQGVHNDAQAPVPLNPELTELKRQIFAGFETLLAPIKQEIKELKDDQKILFECDKSINKSKIEKKFVQNGET